MQGITTKTYLTKKLLKEIFKHKITEEFLIELMANGELEKHFNYYIPTIKLLKRLKIIPNEIKIKNFSRLAKDNHFAQHDIMDIFDCNRDIARLLIERYFNYTMPYYRRNDLLNACLEEGVQTLGLD